MTWPTWSLYGTLSFLDSDIVPDIFDESKLHECPFSYDPKTCTCACCTAARKVAYAKRLLAEEEAINFGFSRSQQGGGATFGSMSDPVPQPQESPRDKYERQRQERYKESDRVWAQVQADEAERKALVKENSVKENIELPPFDLDDVMNNPASQGVNPLNVDPIYMLVDDIESLVHEGKEFVNNPTLAGIASMAIVAIPGKFLDDVGGKLVEEAFKRNPSKTINGRKIINSDLAGSAVKTKGGDVYFDFDGFPDFYPYAEKIVRVDNLTGNRNKDAKLAMDALGITDSNKKEMVWHHHQDGKTMLLVPKTFHSVPDGVGHTGGSAVIKHNKNNPENPLIYLSPLERK